MPWDNQVLTKVKYSHRPMTVAAPEPSPLDRMLREMQALEKLGMHRHTKEL